MKFAQWVYRIAGVYGLLTLLPLYFMEGQLNRQFPPAITQPHYYYGFIGVTLAWQVLFLLLAQDPVRYRLLMLPTLLEKASYLIPLLVLYWQGRVAVTFVGPGLVDLLFLVLFFVAYVKTGAAVRSPTHSSAPHLVEI